MGAARATGVIVAALVAGACGFQAATPVSDSRAGAFEPSLAVFGDGMAVAWYDTRDGHGEIYARPLGADGAPAGPERRLTTGTRDAYEADIQPLDAAAPGDGFIVAWYEKVAEKRFQPRLGRWSRSGAERWVTTLAAEGRNTVARVSGDNIFVAWLENETPPLAGVWAGWWTTGGKPIAPPRRIADASTTTYNLNIAFGPAPAAGVPTALVVFDAIAGTKANEIFLVEDSGSAVRVARLTRDDGFASSYPDLVVSGSTAALTWFDAGDGNEEVYLSVGPLSDFTAGSAPAGQRVTRTKGHSIGAYAAWNGQRIGLAWCDDSAGQNEIYFQDFDASGGALHPARQVTNTRADSLIPTIRAWRSGFALVWTEYVGASGHDVAGRSAVWLTLLEAG